MTLPEPGARLRERYTLLNNLGQGDLGALSLAHDERLARHCIVTWILPDGGLAAEGGRARFLEEARRTAQLTHPNILTPYDFGLWRDQLPFLVLEHVEGGMLSALLEEGPLPPESAVALLLPLLEALEHTHARGLVHGDIKPDNIIVEDGNAKLLDLGFTRFTPRRNTRRFLEERGEEAPGFSGSLPYSSPEQLDGVTDPRSDLWSLGVVLFRLLTGALPFSGDTLTRLADAILDSTRRSPRVSEHRPLISPALDDLVARALEKDLEWRFASATAMLEAARSLSSAPTSVLGVGGASSQQEREDGEPSGDLSARLTFTGPAGHEQLLTLDAHNPRATIGRSADNAISSAHASLSRYHAEIVLEDDHFVLRDPPDARRAPTNKTYLNGVEKPFREQRRLSHGDIIRCGHVPIRFHLGSSPADDPLTRELEALRLDEDALRRVHQRCAATLERLERLLPTEAPRRELQRVTDRLEESARMLRDIRERLSAHTKR